MLQFQGAYFKQAPSFMLQPTSGPISDSRKKLANFFAASVIATLAHFCTLVWLVEFLFLPAVASSVLGFILGAIVSYLLNYRITFTSSAPHLTTIPKFFFVASVGALVNTALMSALVHLIEFHYLPSQIISTVIVFFWSYLANRYWTFRKSIANR